MKISIDWKGEQTTELDCDGETTVALALASIANSIDDSGVIVACNGHDFRLFKEDLDIFRIKNLSVREGDILSVSENNDTENPFVMPELSDNRLQNLVKSMNMKRNPEEMKEEIEVYKQASEIHKSLYKPLILSRWTWMAPALVRHYLNRPDDLGGFIVGYKKWRIEFGLKMKKLDELYLHAFENNPTAFTPIQMLYIKGLLNGHEVVAFIDTGAQHTIFSESLAVACGLSDIIDPRFKTISHGVGGKATAKGTIHHVEFQLSAGVLDLKATVLPDHASGSTNFILGLDVLLRHGCTIDLRSRTLVFDGHVVPLLSVEECSKLTAFGPIEKKEEKMEH